MFSWHMDICNSISFTSLEFTAKVAARSCTFLYFLTPILPDFIFLWKEGLVVRKITFFISHLHKSIVTVWAKEVKVRSFTSCNIPRHLYSDSLLASSTGTLRWVPMCQGLSHFSDFSHHFVLAKLATSSIRVRSCVYRSLCIFGLPAEHRRSRRRNHGILHRGYS